MAIDDHGYDGEVQPARRGKRASLLGGMAWTMLRTGGVVVLQIVLMAVLSRLLSPKEIGWSAAVMTVTNFAQLLSQLGIATAIIQRPVLTNLHLSTAYLASICTGVLQTVLALALAPFFARAFGMPEIEAVFQLTSVVFTINAVSRMARARLTRDLYFHQMAKAEFFSTVACAVVSIALAMMGFGIWSITWGLIAQAIVLTILYMVGEPIPWPFTFDKTAFRELVQLARTYSAASVLGFVASQVDNFIVGRWMGAASLGLYSRAFNLTTRPVNMLVASINRVLYPNMARKQHDLEQLHEMFAKTTTAMAIIVVPIGLTGAVLGPELIRVILSAKWEGAIVPFQILMAGLVVRVGAQTTDAITRAVSKPAGIVVPKLVYAIGVVLGAYYGMRWGLPGVAWGVLLANVLHSVLMAQQTLSATHITWLDYLRMFRTATLVGGAGSGAAWVVASFTRLAGLPDIVTLIAGLTIAVFVTVGMLKYGGGVLLGDEVVQMRNTVGKRLRNRTRRKVATAG